MIKTVKNSLKIVKKFTISLSTTLELVGFISLALGIASFSIPISAIVSGIILIIAGGLTA
jgi:hypothetical protein